MRIGSKITRRNIISHIITLSLHTTLISLILSGCSGSKTDLRSMGYYKPLTESRVISLSVESIYMDREMPCMIYLPKGYGYGKEYPVWYGLNSYSTTESMWIDNGIVEAADELIDNEEIEPLIMIFPYTKDTTIKEITKDLEDGKIDERNMDQFIWKELVPYIDTHYYTITKANGRYIGGFSMGGMIALRIAFHHTDLFSKVGGYSAAVISNDYSGNQLEAWLYPNDNFDEIDDVSNFDKKMGFHNLHVYLDAGNSNDPFSIGLQSLHEALQNRGIQSEFELYEGGHTLRKDSIKDYLKFYVGKQ